MLGLEDVPAYPEPAETETTFEGNALIKARACCRGDRSSALADDSGLTVDILNGMPGVRSARWAGPRPPSDQDNNELLLRQLADVPADDRTAQFVCAMALVWPDGRGRPAWRGVGSADRPLRGARMGSATTRCSFPTGTPQTTAELDPAAKDAISHRGRAVRAIVTDWCRAGSAAERARRGGGPVKTYLDLLRTCMRPRGGEDRPDRHRHAERVRSSDALRPDAGLPPAHHQEGARPFRGGRVALVPARLDQRDVAARAGSHDLGRVGRRLR